jgi:hypothetical protein
MRYFYNKVKHFYQDYYEEINMIFVLLMIFTIIFLRFNENESTLNK